MVATLVLSPRHSAQVGNGMRQVSPAPSKFYYIRQGVMIRQTEEIRQTIYAADGLACVASCLYSSVSSLELAINCRLLASKNKFTYSSFISFSSSGQTLFNYSWQDLVILLPKGTHVDCASCFLMTALARRSEEVVAATAERRAGQVDWTFLCVRLAVLKTRSKSLSCGSWHIMHVRSGSAAVHLTNPELLLLLSTNLDVIKLLFSIAVAGTVTGQDE
jgi:hypothetical protein